MAYIDPKTVDSPRANWKLIEVLRNGKKNNKGDDDAALAIGEWDGERVFAMRWNGSSKETRGVGNPQSRGLPTWFILPYWMNETVLAGDLIPEAKRALVAALMADD
jgi:hypothetical protein